ncbi:putative transcription factor bHLH family [Helianthus debilis subsp. tardiflorus]
MQDNPDMFETTTCFDPNSITHNQQVLTEHHDVHQMPIFSSFEPPADHFHHNHLINMEMDYYQNHQQNNWLPKCSSTMLLYSNPAQVYQTSGQVMYDHPVLPNGLNVAGCGLMFGESDTERGEHSHMYNYEGDAVFEFDAGIVKGRRGRDKKDAIANERHRRQLLNGKFAVLRSLIPNPSEDDRASIVGDAIEYINNLKRDLEELKIAVDRKRCNRSRMKRHKTEDHLNFDVESNTGHDQQAYNDSSSSTMKSSWLQRKSKNVEIDVRIIEDEVTIKLVQQKGISCLLLVSKVLYELNLDVHHVAGGLIGGYYSYLFNNKICEGSSVYASDIANKLIEVVDKQYATVPNHF